MISVLGFFLELLPLFEHFRVREGNSIDPLEGFHVRLSLPVCGRTLAHHKYVSFDNFFGSLFSLDNSVLGSFALEMGPDALTARHSGQRQHEIVSDLSHSYTHNSTYKKTCLLHMHKWNWNKNKNSPCGFSVPWFFQYVSHGAPDTSQLRDHTCNTTCLSVC